MRAASAMRLSAPSRCALPLPAIRGVYKVLRTLPSTSKPRAMHMFSLATVMAAI